MWRKFRRGPRLVRAAWMLRSYAWARLLQGMNGRVDRRYRLDREKGLYIPDLQLWLPKPTKAARSLMTQLWELHAMRKQGIELAFHDPVLRLTVDGLVFELDLEKQSQHVLRSFIDTLNEVFVQQEYAFGSRVEPALIIDVGLNVGFASLFFATRHACPIHSFELFPQTAELAKRQLELNPAVAGRIQVHVCGLAAKSGTLRIPYDPECTPGCGLFSETGSQTAEVEVKRATDALRPLVAEAGGPVAIKLDCEGAEFEILADLQESGLLSAFDVLMIEWHHIAGDPATIEDILHKAGFATFSPNKLREKVGFIYAVKLVPAGKPASVAST